VYSLTGRAARVSAAGLSGVRLRVVREGPIAAIVGERTAVTRPTPEDLRGYDRIVRALASRLPAVLPARFGTSFDDLDELKFVLRSRRASLGNALAHVRNRVQMTVRVVTEPVEGPATSTREAHFGDPRRRRRRRQEGGTSSTGAAYLRARAERAARERHLPAFDPVRRAVERWVRDERIEKRQRIATVFHLVPRRSADAYRRAIERAAPAAGLQMIVSGPWPVYAFVDGW
jgi:hypothetical protein